MLDLIPLPYSDPGILPRATGDEALFNDRGADSEYIPTYWTLAYEPITVILQFSQFEHSDSQQTDCTFLHLDVILV